MTLRCGCANEGDEIVFGPIHECGHDNSTPPPRPPEWRWFHRSADQIVRPFELTLDPDERSDR